MRFFKMAVTFCGVIALSASFSLATPLAVLSHSIVESKGNYDFEITFNRMPDFYTVNDRGYQADYFQFNIDRDNNVPILCFFSCDITVRGGEIYKDGDIPIRDITLPNEPGSGGWGGVVCSVPYSVEWSIFGPIINEGEPVSLIKITEFYRVTFSVDKDVVDSDGQFTYCVQYGQYGMASYLGWDRVVPEPFTVGLMCLGLVFLVKGKTNEKC